MLLRSKNRLLFQAALACSCLLPTWTRADTYTWNSASAGNWTTTSNWTPNANPNGSIDQVLFTDVGSAATLNSSRAIGSVLFNRDGNFSLKIGSSSSTLSISNGISTSSPTGGFTYTISANLFLSGDNIWDVGSNTTLSVSSVVDDDTPSHRALTKNGNGLLILSNIANTYDGATSINAGTIQVTAINDNGSPGALGDGGNTASDLVINGGALRISGTGANTGRLLTIGVNSATIDASLTSGSANFLATGALDISGIGQRVITLTGSSVTDNTLSAQINNDSLNNATSLVKDGAGKWVLSRASAHGYTGTTTVSNGILALSATGTLNPIANSKKVFVDTNGTLDASGLGSSNLRLGPTQTLAGTGNVIGNVVTTVDSQDATKGSKVAPGNTDTPGTLTLQNNFTLTNATTLTIESDGATFSILSVAGTVTLGGSLELKANFHPPLNTPIKILNKTGSVAISGIFAGLAQGTAFHPASGYTDDWYTINYNGGTGNDVFITHVVPEPSLTLLAFSAITVVGRRTRRNAFTHT